jgi:RHS repeat-associated protein
VPRRPDITNAQFSTAAIIGTGGAGADPRVMERVRYEAYGRATHRFPGDFSGDRFVDSADEQMLFDAWGQGIGDPGYNADIDLNRDGVINGDDLLEFGLWENRVPMPAGFISDPIGPDNSIGYAGSMFSLEVQLYCQRFRWYSPVTGRWLQRDPAGPVDGVNLYECVASRPLTLNDPLGLISEAAGACEPCGYPAVCTDADQALKDLERVEALIIESCEADDSDVQMIKRAGMLAARTIWSAAWESTGIALEGAGRAHSIRALYDTDIARRSGSRATAAAHGVERHIGTVAGVGGKCAASAVGSAFDFWELRNAIKNGDRLQIIGSGSAILINFVPGGAVAGMIGSVGAEGINMDTDAKLRAGYSRRNKERCGLFKGMHKQYDDEFERLAEECGKAFGTRGTTTYANGVKTVDYSR